jgi:hypothetical protein
MDVTSPSYRSLQLLRERDYTVIIARTAIEHAANPPRFAERWAAAQTAVKALIQYCEELDPDGLTLYVSRRSEQCLCSFVRYQWVTSDWLMQIVEENYPPRGTNLQEVLQEALNNYFVRKALGLTKKNGEIIIVLLDGEPDDRLAVARSIKVATQKLETDAELGIGFVQIGEDWIARGFLRALDDDLQHSGAKFDIVDTKFVNEIKSEALTDFLLDVLLD